MRPIKFLFTLSLIFLLFFSCKKNRNKIDNLSETEFINLIANNKNSPNGIARIDSLINNNTFSDHKTALLYYNKARYLINLDKYIETITYLNKSLLLFKKEDNKKYVAYTHNLIGSTNIYLKNNDEALKQINLALEIFKKIGDKKNETTALDALAHVQFESGDNLKALETLKKVNKINLQIENFDAISSTYNNIGYILETMNDYDQAIMYYKKSIKINLEINNSNSNAHRNLGAVYLIKNEPEKCISLYMEALKIEDQTGHLIIQKDIYDVLLDSLKGKQIKHTTVTNKYLLNLPIYIIKRDSISKLINNLENEEKIKSIENQYNLLIKKNELNQKLILNEKNKLIFIIVTGLLLFIGLFLFQRNRNIRLSLSQEKLVLEQKVLRTQMNPHFIFNALTSIQKTIFDEDPIKSATYLSKFAKLIRQNFEFVNKTEILLSDDLDALQNYIDTQQLRFDNKFEYNINIDEDINPLQVNIPPMLLQPFIENAIEHGLKPKSSKGLLEIFILRKNELFEFKITDNGIGINANKEKDNREHALDIFLKRLKIRNLGEEKFFSIQSLNNNLGTVVKFSLKLKEW